MKFTSIDRYHANPLYWSDTEKVEWLQKLDKADLELNDWEAGFVGSFAGKTPLHTVLSRAQRAVVVNLANKFKSIR